MDSPAPSSAPATDPPEPPRHETVDFRGLRWSRVLVLLLALLLGLGLGHTVFTGDQRRAEVAEHRAAVLADRLAVARQSADTLRSRLAVMSARAADTAELAGLADRLAHATTGARRARHDVVRLVDGLGTRPAAWLAAAPVLTDLVQGRVARGVRQVVLQLSGPGRQVTRAGPVWQVGGYALARVQLLTRTDEVVAHVRLRGVRTGAVLLVRLDGRRVAHVWLI